MQLKASYYPARNNWHEIPKGNEISFLLYCFPIKGKKENFVERIALKLYNGCCATIVHVCQIPLFLVAEDWRAAFGVTYILVRQLLFGWFASNCYSFNAGLIICWSNKPFIFHKAARLGNEDMQLLVNWLIDWIDSTENIGSPVSPFLPILSIPPALPSLTCP